MINYLAIMMTVSSILCIRSKKQENLEEKRTLELFKDKGLQSILENQI